MHRLCFAFLLSSLFVSAAAIAEDPLASIGDAIANISTLERPGRVGYATVWDGNKYVQCRRMPDRTLRCEAAGVTMQASLGAVLTPERLQTLGRNGWALDPSFGNYVRNFSADVPHSIVARHILDTLTQVYDIAVPELETQTDWVTDVPCPQRNGPSQNLAGLISDARSMRATSIRACSYMAQPVSPRIEGLDDLVAQYGGVVASELQRLRINARRRVYAVFDTEIGYVQCSPKSPSRVLYCEAQSAQSWPALSAVLTPERVERLKALGFTAPGRAPNYWKDYAPESMSEVALATEVLGILHDVYGYSGATRLRIRTEGE